MDSFVPNKDSEDHFESISDFEMSLVWGKEIEFEWKEKKYGLFSELGEKQFLLHEAGKDDMDWYFDTVDEVLDFEIDGQPLRSIITDVSVLWRNI